MDSAAVLTLDYGKRDRQGNSDPEIGVVMCSTTWSDLVDLLADPVGYIQSQQEYNFKYATTSEKDPKPSWTLLPPVTAILECGYPDFRTIGQFARMLELGSPFIRQYERIAFDKEGDKENKVSIAEELTDAFLDIFEKGAFQAEFSRNTRTLFIRYFQPLKTPTEPRYKQNLSKVTVSSAQGVFTNVLSSTHFDLVTGVEGKVSVRDRAEFVVEFLENPLRICERLNKRITTSPLQVCRVTMSKSGANDLKVSTTEDYKGKSFVTRSRDPKTDPWPRLVVEGLSENAVIERPDGLPPVRTFGPVEPCTSYVTTVSGDDLYLEGGIVKTY